MSDGISIDDEDIRITIEDEDDGPAPASSRKPVPTRRTDAVEDHGRAFRELDAARRDLLEATKSSVEAALEARTSIASNLEREIQKALTEGDFESVTTGQRQLAKLEAERLDLERRRAALATTTVIPADPVEAFAHGRTARTQQWIREHADLVGDARGQAKAAAAHHDALAEGLEPDTDEYFSRVERFIGANRRKESGSMTRTNSRPETYNPADARTHVNGTQVRLTAGEAEAATNGVHVWGRHDLAAGRIKNASLIGQPIGHREMARRKAAMVADGYYDRIG